MFVNSTSEPGGENSSLGIDGTTDISVSNFMSTAYIVISIIGKY